MKKASIIIPSFNRDNLLKHTLNSYTRQTIFKDIEIIVVDDFPFTDSCQNLCKQYNVNFISTKRNNSDWRGPCISINIGVKKATADIIVITNAEMYILDNNSLENLINMVNKNDLFYSTASFIKDDDGRFLNGLESNNIFNGDINNFPNLRNTLPFFMAIRKDIVFEIRGYDEEFCNGVGADDRDFVERIQKYGCSMKVSDSKIIHLYHPRKHWTGE